MILYLDSGSVRGGRQENVRAPGSLLSGSLGIL
jgi:hypothetical protein